MAHRQWWSIKANQRQVMGTWLEPPYVFMIWQPFASFREDHKTGQAIAKLLAAILHSN